MTTKTILIIASIAAAGFIGYKVYQNVNSVENRRKKYAATLPADRTTLVGMLLQKSGSGSYDKLTSTNKAVIDKKTIDDLKNEIAVIAVAS